MATKLEVYEAALVRISNMIQIGNEGAVEVAQTALDQFIVDHEADRIAKTNEVKDFMLANGLIFASAQELSDALNAKKLTTTRGKAWTKSTATRVLADVRPLIEGALRGSVISEAEVAAPVAEPQITKIAQQPFVASVVTNEALQIMDEAITAGTITPNHIAVEEPKVANFDDFDELDKLLAS